MTLMLPPDTDFEQENCFQRFLVKYKRSTPRISTLNYHAPIITETLMLSPKSSRKIGKPNTSRKTVLRFFKALYLLQDTLLDSNMLVKSRGVVEWLEHLASDLEVAGLSSDRVLLETCTFP